MKLSARRRDLLTASFASPLALALFSGPAAGQAKAPPRRKSGGLLFAKGDKLVMIGDSVTDAGHKDPGEGLFGAIGTGYVMLVDALLGCFHPELGIRVVNKGVSGNTTRDLQARWTKDVMDQKPHWLSVMIGINDVWRQFDLPRMTEKAVLLEEYERNLDDLVARAKPEVKGIIVMTPYYIEPNRTDRMRATMDRYGEACKRVAGKHGTLFVDTQVAFDRILAFTHSSAIAWDRVHPDPVGHLVLARAFLDAVGFRWGAPLT